MLGDRLGSLGVQADVLVEGRRPSDGTPLRAWRRSKGKTSGSPGRGKQAHSRRPAVPRAAGQLGGKGLGFVPRVGGFAREELGLCRVGHGEANDSSTDRPRAMLCYLCLVPKHATL